MFAYWDYVGTDFAADMAAIAADPTMKDWWAVCGPCQVPFETRRKGEWWARDGGGVPPRLTGPEGPGHRPGQPTTASASISTR